MKWPYTWWLSWRYLTARRKEVLISVHSLFAVLGVAVGVAALITVIAVMTGFDRDLRDKVMGMNAHIVIEHAGGIHRTAALVRQIENMKDVRVVSPYVSGQAILKAGDRVTGLAFRGVDAGREFLAGGAARYITEGAQDFGSGRGLWIGAELARMMSLEIGSPCTLISSIDGSERRFEVTAVFDSGMYEYDTTLVLMSVEMAAEMLKLQDKVTGLAVWADSPKDISALRIQLDRTLGPFYWVRSWFDLNQNLFSAIRIEKIVMFVILTLIVFVAAFNIASSLTMTVMEKTREIGILRTLGATAGQVHNIFFLQGLWVGLFGLLLGTAGGVFLTLNLNRLAESLERLTGIEIFPPNIYYFDRIPAVIQTQDILAVSLCALAVTLLASLYPARHAARLEPAAALRYE